MSILRDLFSPLYARFPASRHGKKRAALWVYILMSIILHFTSARSSHLLRALQTLFELDVGQRRFYTFMASPKLPWERLWPTFRATRRSFSYFSVRLKFTYIVAAMSHEYPVR
jgi:hypothetical protein